MDKQRLGAHDEMIHRNIAAGNFRDALVTMVRAYQHVMVGFCVNMLGDDSQAEDLAQEVFLAAFNGMPRFRKEASVRTWLIAIARNQCLKNLKKRGRRRLLKNQKQDEIAENVHPVSPSLYEEEQDEQVQLVRQGLKHLSGSERALLIMRYDTGLPIAEVAHIIGISVSSVRRRLARALRHLKEIVENETQ